MLRSIKRRVSKLEGQLGQKQGAPLIIVHPGETKEEAMEKHFREHPDHRECKPIIFILLAAKPRDRVRDLPRGLVRNSPKPTTKKGPIRRDHCR